MTRLNDSDISNEYSNISWPLNRPTQRAVYTRTMEDEPTHPRSNGRSVAMDSTYSDILPGRARALDGIAIRGFLLGITLGTTAITAVILAYLQYQIWRVPIFITTLSLFHFLEFYTTARYNTPTANIDAFLLSRNGMAYNIAHASATIECTITSLLFPAWQLSISNPIVLCIGFTSIFIGQLTRSAAMAHAGTNFNHTVQTRKAEGHALVTSGVYHYLRHPAYFGFFWWGLGTQMVLGNVVCFVGYAYLLWSFFRRRIRREEELLVDFFGDEYVKYRSETSVGIPFIW